MTSSPQILAHETVVHRTQPPQEWGLVCHGILGSRRNWRSFARRLVDQHPNIGLVLVDLRNHGDNPPFVGPHTLADCAADLDHLCQHLQLQPTFTIGHSFGGKVVLQHASSFPPSLRTVWVLDSRPDPATDDERANNEVSRVITALRRLPGSFASRTDVVPLLQEMGFSPSLASWMTTNLERGEDRRWTWRFHLDAVEQMISDYFYADLRPVLTAPIPDLTIHVVRAERSDRWPAEILAWFEALPDGSPGRLHVLPDSGHWVHADNPEGLLSLMDDEW